MSRQEVINIVLERLRDVCRIKGIPETKPFGEATVLIGSEAILDSLGLVLLLVQVEESLNGPTSTPVPFVQSLVTDDLVRETVGTLGDRLFLMMENGT
jgi:hypothetical protein